MGVVCTRTADGEALRDRCDVERSALINTYYHSHHNKLTRMVDDCLEQHDQCLIVDCHSFPAQALPYELDKNWPDICIGTDTYHTSTELKDRLSTMFEALVLDCIQLWPHPQWVNSGCNLTIDFRMIFI